MKRVGTVAAQNHGSVVLNTIPKYTGSANQVTSQMMTYNRLNLVQTAQIDTSMKVYLYNTQGNKMAQKVGRQYKAYLFGSEYVNGNLARMQTAEGFVSKNLNWKAGSTEKKYSYCFTVSDHLGNIRVVVDEQANLQQKYAYLAFLIIRKI